MAEAECETVESLEEKIQNGMTFLAEHTMNKPVKLYEVQMKNLIGKLLGLELKEEDLADLDEELNIFLVSLYDRLPQQEENRKRIKRLMDLIQNVTSFPANVTFVPIVLKIDENDDKIMLIRLLKITKTDGNNRSIDYFISLNEGRYYTGFNDWLNNNHLPPGYVTYPLDGILLLDETTGQAKLGKSKTPFNKISYKVQEWLDFLTNVVTLTTATVTVTAIVLAFVCPVGAASYIAWIGAQQGFMLVSAGVCATYTTAQNIRRLTDRYQHGQTLSLRSSTARREWFQVAGTLLNFINLGVLFKVEQLAVSGFKFSYMMGAGINTMMGITYTANTIGMINELVQIPKDWPRMAIHERASCLLACATSVVLFGHGLKFRTARQLIYQARENAYTMITSQLKPDEKFMLGQQRTKLGLTGTLKSIDQVARGQKMFDGRLQTAFKNITKRSGVKIKTLKNLDFAKLKILSPVMLSRIKPITRWEAEILKIIQQSGAPIFCYYKIRREIIKENRTRNRNFDEMTDEITDYSNQLVNSFLKRSNSYIRYMNVRRNYELEEIVGQQSDNRRNIEDEAREHFGIPANQQPDEFFLQWAADSVKLIWQQPADTNSTDEDAFLLEDDPASDLPIDNNSSVQSTTISTTSSMSDNSTLDSIDLNDLTESGIQKIDDYINELEYAYESSEDSEDTEDDIVILNQEDED